MAQRIQQTFTFCGHRFFGKTFWKHVSSSGSFGYLLRVDEEVSSSLSSSQQFILAAVNDHDRHKLSLCIRFFCSLLYRIAAYIKDCTAAVKTQIQSKISVGCILISNRPEHTVVDWDSQTAALYHLMLYFRRTYSIFGPRALYSDGL